MPRRSCRMRGIRRIASDDRTTTKRLMTFVSVRFGNLSTLSRRHQSCVSLARRDTGRRGGQPPQRLRCAATVFSLFASLLRGHRLQTKFLTGLPESSATKFGPRRTTAQSHGRHSLSGSVMSTRQMNCDSCSWLSSSPIAMSRRSSPDGRPRWATQTRSGRRSSFATPILPREAEAYWTARLRQSRLLRSLRPKSKTCFNAAVTTTGTYSPLTRDGCFASQFLLTPFFAVAGLEGTELSLSCSTTSFTST